MSELAYAHGGPVLQARLRAAPEDFFVDEDLGFEADGAGEHVFVRVEKRGANTEWVARELAQFAGVAADAVSFAGMKDRHAVTRQTFSVQVPIKREIDWSALAHAEFSVLSAQRHSRKLKRGALRGNHFRLVLRDCIGDRAAAERRLAALAAEGVPNYFGEQRFGREAANVDKARAMFAGKRVARHERSLLLSAARSELFNRILACRVESGTWNRAMDGDVWMLDGSHSIFGPEPPSAELLARVESGDIHPTAPLWGEGDLRSTGAVAALETAIADTDAELARGLSRAGLSQERRSLRLRPLSMRWDWQDDGLSVAFSLPAGCYATTILRELFAQSAAAVPEWVPE